MKDTPAAPNVIKTFFDVLPDALLTYSRFPRGQFHEMEIINQREEAHRVDKEATGDTNGCDHNSAGRRANDF